jgi:two-component system, OmpR family, alkaline phosphatase synthesis response regulator PhoP
MGFKKTVIGVDDDHFILDFLKVVCTANDYDFYGCVGGEECLNILKDIKPDIILLDVNMPVMNGIQTLEEIKKNYPRMRAPIVFLSAEADIKTILTASSKGGAGYILKPINGLRLIEQIEISMDRVQQELVN